MFDKRLERAAYNSAPIGETLELINLYKTKYSNFNASHFFDKYKYEHNGKRCYTWVKNKLQDKGYIKRNKKRGIHRKKRPRSPMPGMMLHQDGSTHNWIEGHSWDLIVTMDDANNEIYSAFFVEEEGTFSSFIGVKEVIEKEGLFCSLYTDRGSHYWLTPKVGGKVDKTHLTQFRRAMNQLGINMIPSYSPEARGRSERMFRTLQERLPKELKLSDITDMDASNKFLKEKFIPYFNNRFKVKSYEAGSAFVSWKPQHFRLDDILCIQEERTVKKDNTVSYNGKILQISKSEYRYSYNKARVHVHEYVNGSLAIFYGPHCLGRYDINGKLIEKVA